MNCLTNGPRKLPKLRKITDQEKTSLKNKKEIFLVPYSHLDTQWRWEYPTTINKYIKNTLEESISLSKKYPGFQLNFPGAIRYSFMKDYYPEEFEIVKALVKEGRWHTSGTCLDETDTLIPSVESMIRNILYGDRWAKRNFGKSSRDYMIPDCFGFPANMPSIMAHCGINGFSSNKLTWKSAVGIPFETGAWKGPDGSEIISAFNPCRYDSRLFPLQMSFFRLKRLKNLGRKNGIWKSFQYYGVGDIGGSPTEGSVKNAISSIKRSEKKAGGLKVRQGPADVFFDEITSAEKEKMDRYEGDLLLINHSAGVLTSAAIMKRWNRKNEQMAFAAEAAAVTALLFAGAPYPSQKIERAWERIISSQMHDILPGTCTPTAYEYSQNDEVIALKTWTTIMQDSAQAIAPFVKGNGEILLFNPCSETRKDPVDIDLPDMGKTPGPSVVFTDADGNEIPGQLTKNINGKISASFIPELPPLSWSRFSVSSEQAHTASAVEIQKHQNYYILENSLYRIKITLSGKVESILHKRLDWELLKEPLAYELQKERPVNFPAWNMDWKDRKKKPFQRLQEGGEVSIIEEGPLRCSISIKTSLKSSELIKEVSLSAESEIVEFTERINWKEKGCSLKLAVNSNLESPEVTFNWETSRIKRGINNSKCFEMPSRLWADISGKDRGISIIEDSKYGYDHPREDTLRMTLLYTPSIWYVHGFWDQRTQDWGRHTIRYGIFAHEGNLKMTDVLARRFNQPVRAFKISGASGSGADKNLSLLNSSSQQLGLLAVKKAQDSDDVVLRFYERYGKSCSSDVNINFPVKSISETNGLEEKKEDITVNGNTFNAEVIANGISSYIIKPETSPQQYNVTQEALSLEYNCKLIGKNNESGCALFPAELTPSNINSGPVSFTLKPGKELNSLQCKGQKIAVPAGYNVLSILCGSMEETNAVFRWMDSNNQILKEENCRISSMTAFAGQWDTRTWKKEPGHFIKNRRDYVWINKCTGVKPGYINRDRLEWYSTHTHKNGTDQAYRFGYLYTLIIDIPKNAESIELPDNSAVYIMAATVSEQNCRAADIRSLKDKYDF